MTVPRDRARLILLYLLLHRLYQLQAILMINFGFTILNACVRNQSFLLGHQIRCELITAQMRSGALNEMSYFCTMS
jgi:hypothetical protein